MRKFLPFVLPLAIVTSGGGASRTLHAQPAQRDAERIAKILSDWNNRHKRFKSARYVLSGTQERTDRPENSKLPTRTPVKYVVLFDFVRGRIRMETDSSGPAVNFERYIRNASIRVYDGSILQDNLNREVGEWGQTDPNVHLSKGSLGITIDTSLWPLLSAHGIVPTVNKEAQVDKLPIQHDSEEFESRGELRHQGNPCIVLRTDPVASTPYLVDEFWVDPAKESAVLRHIYFTGKIAGLRYEIDYQKSEQGWMPRSWICDTILTVARLTVESMELNPTVTDADFTLPIPRGSIVATNNFPEPGKGLDPFKPAMGRYRVEADGKWTTLEETGFTTAEGIELPPEPRHPRWLWWTGASLIGIVGIVIAALVYRRRMRRLTIS